MIKEGKELAKIDDKIVVKVPMIKDGVKAIKKFKSEGIRTNCTLVFSPGQAILAAKAGASYVSPFIGRLDDIAQDGLELIAQIRLIYDNFAFETEILSASVRHTIHLIKCAEIGSDVVTCPLSVITGLLKSIKQKAKSLKLDFTSFKLSAFRFKPNFDNSSTTDRFYVLQRPGSKRSGRPHLSGSEHNPLEYQF